MRIAIFATRREPSIVPKIKLIEKTLKKMRCDVDTSYFDGTLDQMRNDLEYTYNKVKRIIQKADLVIIDVTNYSTGMGLIIGRVIGFKKPLLVLFDKASQPDKERPILARAHEKKSTKVFFREYTEESLKSILETFIEESKKILNTKYLFNLTPDLANYLQWASENYNKPMVDILREVLLERMDKDKEWKKYLNEK